MTTNQSDLKECISICNSLLRGELSAVETYGQAIEKFRDHPGVKALAEIQQVHRTHAAKLRQNVMNMGGEPSDDSGAWGTFAAAVQSTSNFFGKESAISSLQQGEKHGLEEYEDALDDDDVMMECKQMYRETMIPATKANIRVLEQLEKQVD